MEVTSPRCIIVYDEPAPYFLEGDISPTGFEVHPYTGRAFSGLLKRLGASDAVVIAVNISHDCRIGGADGRYTPILKEFHRQGKAQQAFLLFWNANRNVDDSIPSAVLKLQPEVSTVRASFSFRSLEQPNPFRDLRQKITARLIDHVSTINNDLPVVFRSRSSASSASSRGGASTWLYAPMLVAVVGLVAMVWLSRSCATVEVETPEQCTARVGLLQGKLKQLEASHRNLTAEQEKIGSGLRGLDLEAIPKSMELASKLLVDAQTERSEQLNKHKDLATKLVVCNRESTPARCMTLRQEAKAALARAEQLEADEVECVQIIASLKSRKLRGQEMQAYLDHVQLAVQAAHEAIDQTASKIKLLNQECASIPLQPAWLRNVCTFLPRGHQVRAHEDLIDDTERRNQEHQKK